jgi:hypothetical protein
MSIVRIFYPSAKKGSQPQSNMNPAREGGVFFGGSYQIASRRLNFGQVLSGFKDGKLAGRSDSETPCRVASGPRNDPKTG